MIGQSLQAPDSPDQVEDEALQGAQVSPAELVDDGVHAVDHIPPLWLTWSRQHTAQQAVRHTPQGTPSPRGALTVQSFSVDHGLTYSQSFLKVPLR